MADQASGEPLRVAIVGAGPAGFYTADYLLKSESPRFSVDLFDRLPVPFGLVRYGVAPDHQNIKAVVKAFDKIAAHPRFRFLGNVEIGRDLTTADLSEHYHQVVYAAGAPNGRELEVPGEALRGSASATEFVGWYNGHPDFRHLTFDLSGRTAVVVGLGNVAMDVARILVRSPEELAATDIADYALEALKQSQIREVVVLGRRGPAQAAFDQGELQDIAELTGVDVLLNERYEGLALGEGQELDAAAKKNVSYVTTLPVESKGAERRVVLRFLAAPVELTGTDRVQGVRVERTVLSESKGRISARGSGNFDTIEAGLVLRSVGYRGAPIPGVPFDAASSTIPNVEGRVLQAPGGAVLPRIYAVGWIKRGPTGLIGSNRTDAKETSAHVIEDGKSLNLQLQPADALTQKLHARGVRAVSYGDWQRIDGAEKALGQERGRVRVKLLTAREMLAVLE
jgi:ferredoxin--NADP+ reductase